MSNLAILSETSQRILASLEERRSDNVVAILNTIADNRGDVRELGNFRLSLIELLDNSLVMVSMEGFYPVNQDIMTSIKAIDIARQIEEWFRFDSESGYWSLSKGDPKTTRLPCIILTENGLERSRALLVKRGYQWWRLFDRG